MIELFRDFWWLVFPVFGMLMAGRNVARENRAADHVLERARRNLEQR